MDHSWPDMWASSSAGSPSTLGSRRSSSAWLPFDLLPSLSTLRHCAGRVDRHVVGLGPSSKSLRFEVFAGPSTYDRLVLRPCVLAPSHRSPKVAPPTLGKESHNHSTSKPRVSAEIIGSRMFCKGRYFRCSINSCIDK